VRWLSSIVLAACVIVGAACSYPPATVSGTVPSGQRIVRARFSTSTGPVETAPLWVADSDAERARGLMGRTSLPSDGGMVFRFPAPTEAGFWMKDTSVPLSIAFRAEGRIIAILDMEPCTNEPCPVYRPGASYETAIEMRRGWFDEHGVEIGDRVELIGGPA
jgi:uncharacterized protein